MQSFRRPESVLVIVATRTGEFLLLRRQRPENYWQSVTGSLEWGETPRQAATRELVEETGLVVSHELVDCNIVNAYVISARFGHRYAPGVRENAEHVWRVLLERRREIALNESEHLEHRWLEARDAIELASSPTNREAIRHVVEHLERPADE